MAIFLTENSRVIVQGMTGSEGRKHTQRMLSSGTNVVGGVTPGKGGQSVDFEGATVPVFDSVLEAVEATGADVAVVFVPPKFAKGAVIESVDAGVPLVIVITEGVPVKDTAEAFAYAQSKGTSRVIGPNCPGIISPGKANIGITAGHIAKAPVEGKPNVGIVSRSGTLTYQALYELKLNDIGVTTCVGIGGDPVPGTSFIDCLAAFEADPDTKAVMMIGEIGGSAEEEAAEYIKTMSKPVASYIAGVTAPAGKKMGHAGAIVSGGKGTAAAKQEALEAAGVRIGQNPTEAGTLMVDVVSQL